MLNPRRVEFGSSTWTNVTSVSVGRSARHVLTEWGDGGAHVVFADVPEQLVTVRVVQEMLGDDMDRVRPGERGTLSFVTGQNSSDAGTREVTIDAVVRTVSYETSVSRGSRRYVELVAISPDGVSDPVGVDDA
ncbi:MAG: hypothetical protein ACIARR_11250 [Phycisphaerales bacterium JB059]